MLCHGRVHRFPIVDTVSHKAIDFSVYLGKQAGHLGRILGMVIGDHRSEDPPGVIPADVQFPPMSTPLIPTPGTVPLTLTADLQAGAVYDQAYRSCLQLIEMAPDIDRATAPRQRCVIRTREIQSHQFQDRSEEALSLA
jgi:hypothetical protein